MKQGDKTVCDCGHTAISNGFSTGYGTFNGHTYCFECCGKHDKQRMIEDGRMVLYLSLKDGKWTVSNWPGTLVFPCRVRKGSHNIAGSRYDVWFSGPDNTYWHGVQYGENTQLCHCKRNK